MAQAFASGFYPSFPTGSFNNSGSLYARPPHAGLIENYRHPQFGQTGGADHAVD